MQVYERPMFYLKKRNKKKKEGRIFKGVGPYFKVLKMVWQIISWTWNEITLEFDKHSAKSCFSNWSCYTINKTMITRT